MDGIVINDRESSVILRFFIHRYLFKLIAMQTNITENITEQDLITITQLLGREPRGLEGVAVRDKNNVPVVIQVASIVNNKPFPTLFWLIDKRLNYAIDQIEAMGLIAELQGRIDESLDLQRQLQSDHKAHIALRYSLMSDTTKQHVDALGYTEVLASRGIGGIADYQRIRCLHTYYASHLVVPNTVGQLLDDYWRAHDIGFAHLV